MSTLVDNVEYHEKSPDIYMDFIYYLMDNKVDSVSDSLTYFFDETTRSTSYTFSKGNLLNYISSQKNNFPETNKEIVYLENLQNELFLVSDNCVELKIEDYFKYINNEFDFVTGEVYSTEVINSVGFRNNLLLI